MDRFHVLQVWAVALLGADARFVALAVFALVFAGALLLIRRRRDEVRHFAQGNYARRYAPRS